MRRESTLGVWYTACAYILWGFLPLYWKPLATVSPFVILAHRIIWSFLLTLILIFLFRKTKLLFKNTKEVFTNRKTGLAVLASSILISINWLTYIWAVNTDKVMDASLGYYINPLISVLLGVLILKEKLSKWEMGSFGIALIGVVILTIDYGHFPWVAFILAISFGLYSLTKKLSKFDSLISLTFETMFVIPIALIYLMLQTNTTSFGFGSNVLISALLIGSGLATAIPLLLFSLGAKRIPLSMIGFLQYIAPTIMLVLGVFVFHETFTKIHLIAFTFIWIALIIYTIGKNKWVKHWVTTKNLKIVKRSHL
jgi:chloramphenicol-sensitive protein RarD